VFLGAKYIITLERVRLGVKILEIVKLLKSWVYITKTTNRALLSSVFINSRFINKILKILKREGDSDEVIVMV